MNEQQERGGSLRSRVGGLLRSDDFEGSLVEWSRFSARRVINPLLSFLYSPDETLKWRAVTAVGFVMARMADQDMESARVIMRRLMWSLNDESGGIGWGAPEAMGEIMAAHGKLAEEYFRILVSYIREDGNDLENDLLKCGVLWGLGRLAGARPHLLQDSAPHLLCYLESAHPVFRGLAIWVLSFLKPLRFREQIERFLGDQTQIRIYHNGSLNQYRIGELAGSALESSE